MIKSKKQMFIVIGASILMFTLLSVTYAFFNYTRTGTSNIIKVGRIYFNSEQGNSINLTNAFPIDKANVNSDTDNVGSVSIHITGDTTYTNGIEYKVSAVNINNTIGSGYDAKSIPISIDVSYSESANETIGTEDTDYFTNRGGNSSIYKVLAGEAISNGNTLLVGYIKPDATGIDGTITIKAFVDKDYIAITDTYPSGNYSETIGKNTYIINENAENSEIAACVSYLTEHYYDDYLRNDETLENFCNGTSTLRGYTVQKLIDYTYFSTDVVNYLKGINIVIQTEYAVTKRWTNGTTNEWLDGRIRLTTEEWNSLQASGLSFQVKVEANEGLWVDNPGNTMKSLPKFGVNSNVKEIYFNNMSYQEMHQRYEAATYKQDITYNFEGEVLAWLEPNQDDNTKYNMYIASDGQTNLVNCRYFFYDANISNVEKIEFNNTNFSRVENLEDMFYNLRKIKELSLSHLDFSNVTTMENLFYNCEELERVDMHNMDLQKVRSMKNMFYENNSLIEVNFDNVKTRDLTTIIHMFYNANNLEVINLEGFGGDNLSDNLELFNRYSSKAREINMKNFNFGTVTSLNSEFSGMRYLETVDLTNAKFGSVNSLSYLFNNCTNLDTVILDNALMNNVSILERMFYGCSNLTDVSLENVSISNVTNMANMFYECSSLTNIDLSGFNTTSISTGGVSNMFYNCSSLTTIYVSNLWNVSNVSTASIFYGCTSLVGGNGTEYDSTKVDKTMAVVDTPSTPGYLTLKTN